MMTRDGGFAEEKEKRNEKEVEVRTKEMD